MYAINYIHRNLTKLKIMIEYSGLEPIPARYTTVQFGVIAKVIRKAMIIYDKGVNLIIIQMIIRTY